MEVSESQARLIRDCVAEAMMNRQRLGAPIPQRVRDLLAYVSADGHEKDLRAGQLGHDPSDLIDTSQVADILGCSRRHARRLAGDLDGLRCAGRILFSRHTVTEYANARSAP